MLEVKAWGPTGLSVLVDGLDKTLVCVKCRHGLLEPWATHATAPVDTLGSTCRLWPSRLTSYSEEVLGDSIHQDSLLRGCPLCISCKLLSTESISGTQVDSIKP